MLVHDPNEGEGTVLNCSPWYNHNGWLSIKHQVTYLLLILVLNCCSIWPIVKNNVNNFCFNYFIYSSICQTLGNHIYTKITWNTEEFIIYHYMSAYTRLYVHQKHVSEHQNICLCTHQYIWQKNESRQNDTYLCIDSQEAHQHLCFPSFSTTSQRPFGSSVICTTFSGSGISCCFCFF